MQAIILAAGDHGAFVALVAAHVVSAVVGSGAIALGGVYGGTARHIEKPGALAEVRRFFATSNRAALVTLAVPFFGVGALLAGGRSSQLGRPWVASALVVWLAIAGLLTAVVRPAEERLRGLLAAAGPPGAGATGGPMEVGESAGRRAEDTGRRASAGGARRLAGAGETGGPPEAGESGGRSAGETGGPPEVGGLPMGLDVAGVADAARRLSWASAVCDVGFVIALGLMIWQP